MKMQSPPESCPRCGGTRLVAILWKCSFLDRKEKDAIAAERAYLGLSHRYFTSVDQTLVVGRFIAKLSELPAWACLVCSPEWRGCIAWLTRNGEPESRRRLCSRLRPRPTISRMRPSCSSNSVNSKRHTCPGTSGYCGN